MHDITIIVVTRQMTDRMKSAAKQEDEMRCWCQVQLKCGDSAMTGCRW